MSDSLTRAREWRKSHEMQGEDAWDIWGNAERFDAELANLLATAIDEARLEEAKCCRVNFVMMADRVYGKWIDIHIEKLEASLREASVTSKQQQDIHEPSQKKFPRSPRGERSKI